MKKYFIFIITLSFLYVFRSSFVEERGCFSSSLYQELIGEDFGQLDHKKKLNIIIGIDYLPYEFIEIFEQLTGIKVHVDIFDSNEILEAKLLAGGSQYDIVFPTAWPNLARQLSANIYRKIDHKRIDFLKFNPIVLKKLGIYDKGNFYGIPYQYGISGIGMEADIIEKIFPGADKHDLGLFLDPKKAEKLAKVRFSVYDSAGELFPMILCYLGLNPESIDKGDIKKAADHLKQIRPFIYKFTEFGFEDLSSQNVALTLGTSGDIIKVREDTGRKNIKFFYPKQGTALWVDVVAIPRGAMHINNVYAFFKFLFHPKVIAAITNRTHRANCVTEANQYVDEEIVTNENIYPSLEFSEKCYITKPVPADIETLRTRLLTKIKSEK